jgi:hypothetical protein
MGTARKQGRIPDSFVVPRWLRNPEHGCTTRIWRLRERMNEDVDDEVVARATM